MLAKFFNILRIGSFACCLCCTVVAHAQQVTANDYVAFEPFPQDGSKLSKDGIFLASVRDSYFQTLKVYIPPGTYRINLSAFLGQNTTFPVLTRLGKPPEGKTFYSIEELFQNTANYQKEAAFARLLAGEEVIHPNGGGSYISLSGNGVLTNYPILKGIWLYVRVLDGVDPNVRDLNFNTFVDMELYNSLKNTIAYSPSDTQYPIQDLQSPVRPTGIAFPSSVTSGGSIRVNPIPSNAIAIGSCSVDQTVPLARYITINRYTFQVASGAPDGKINVSCGDVTAGLAAATTPTFTTQLTVGSPAALTGLALSANYINITNPAPITINPVPDNASIGSCSLSGEGAGLATVSGNIITLNSGAAITAPTQTTVTCTSNISASFTIQPPPSLTLSQSTLSQASNTGITVRKSDGTPVSSCSFVPNTPVYLDWLPASSSIKFKADAPKLTQKQTVSVTCDGSLSATLTLDPAPVGRLYPKKDSTDPKKMLLRWQETDANGEVILYPLADKYPKYPTIGSNTKFECSEIDTQGNPKNPPNFSFSPSTGTAEPPYLTLTANSSAPLLTKIRCTVTTTGFPPTPVEGSTKDLPPINITNNTWEIAEPTLANPILDDRTGDNAKFSVYVPSAGTKDVPVVVMLYVPSDATGVGEPHRNVWGMLKSPANFISYTGQSDNELLYQTVSATAPSRVIEVDTGFPRAGLKELQVKAQIFYRGAQWWQQLTNNATQWDSTK